MSDYKLLLHPETNKSIPRYVLIFHYTINKTYLGQVVNRRGGVGLYVFSTDILPYIWRSIITKKLRSVFKIRDCCWDLYKTKIKIHIINEFTSDVIGDLQDYHMVHVEKI
jgi:hypothetical protein